MFTLQNKVALVTGAGSGIGASIAETFAQAKAYVFVTDCDEQGGHETVKRIQAANGSGEFLQLDVAKEEQCQQAVERVHGRKQRLDILVNNAGIGHVGTILNTSGADLDRLFAVNVRGVFSMAKAFLPGML